jgi:hypothetical protein
MSVMGMSTDFCEEFCMRGFLTHAVATKHKGKIKQLNFFKGFKNVG